MEGIYFADKCVDDGFKAIPRIAAALEIHNQIEILDAMLRAGSITMDEYSSTLSELLKKSCSESED